MKTIIFKFYLLFILLILTSATCFTQTISEAPELSDQLPASSPKDLFIPQDGTPLLLQSELPLLETIWQDLENEKSNRHFSKSIGHVGFISLNKQSKGFRNKVVTVTGRLLQTRSISLNQNEIKKISAGTIPPKTIHYTIFESWILLDDEKKTPLRLITENIPIGTVLTSTLLKNKPNDASENKLLPNNPAKDRSIKNESSSSDSAPISSVSSKADTLINKSSNTKLNSIQYGKERIQVTGVYYRLTPFTDGLDFYNTPTIVARSFQFLTKSAQNSANSEQKVFAPEHNITIKTKSGNSAEQNENSVKYNDNSAKHNGHSAGPKIDEASDKDKASSRKTPNNYQLRSRLLLLLPILFLWIIMRRYVKRVQNNRAPKSPFLIWGIILFSGMILSDNTDLEFMNFLSPVNAQTALNVPLIKKDQKSVNNNEVKKTISSPLADVLFDHFYRLAQIKKNPENGIDFRGKIQKIEWIEFTKHEDFSEDLKGYYRISLLEKEKQIVIYSLELPLFQINKKGLTFKKSKKTSLTNAPSDPNNTSQTDLSINGLSSEEKRIPTTDQNSFSGIGQIIGGRGISLDAFDHIPNNIPKSLSSEKLFNAPISQERNTSSKAENAKTRKENNHNNQVINKQSAKTEKENNRNNQAINKQSTKTQEQILILYKPEWYPTGIIGGLKIDAGTLDQVPVFPNNALTLLKKEENQLRKMGKNFNDSAFTELREKRQEVLRALRFTNNDTPFVQTFLRGIKKASPGKLKSEAAKEASSGLSFSVVELFNRPENWQGKLITLKGRARRVVYIPITDEKFRKKFGQDHYYQIYLYTADSQGFPLIISVPQLPKTLKIGAEDNYREEIELTAFFCKTWAYRASGKIESKKTESKKMEENKSEREKDQNAMKSASNSDPSSSSFKTAKNSSPEEDTWLHAPFLIGGDVQHFPQIDKNSKSNFPWPVFWGFAFLIFTFYFIYLFIRIFIRIRNRFLSPRKDRNIFDKDLH